MTFSPSLVLDIILAIICIFVIIKYSIKGFLKTILDIVRLGVSIILAIMFRGVLANLLNTLFMNKVVYNWVYGSVSKVVSGAESKINFVSIYENNPEFYSNVLSNFGLDFYELQYSMESLSEETSANISKMISDPLANMFSVIISVLVIFIVSMILLYFVVKLVDKITKIKGINIINKILGVIFGVALAAIIIWAITLLIEILMGTLGPMLPNIFNSELTEKSMIINLLKEIGLLDILNIFKTQITGAVK